MIVIGKIYFGTDWKMGVGEKPRGIADSSSFNLLTTTSHAIHPAYAFHDKRHIFPSHCAHQTPHRPHAPRAQTRLAERNGHAARHPNTTDWPTGTPARTGKAYASAPAPLRQSAQPINCSEVLPQRIGADRRQSLFPFPLSRDQLSPSSSRPPAARARARTWFPLDGWSSAGAYTFTPGTAPR